MEFEPCGNPVYAQRADHRPTLTAKQQGTIKEQDLVHYPFGEGSRGDLASPPSNRIDAITRRVTGVGTRSDEEGDS